MHLRPKSIASRISSKGESVKSKITEFKKKKIIEVIARMDDD
jgi:hypothetical protein